MFAYLSDWSATLAIKIIYSIWIFTYISETPSFNESNSIDDLTNREFELMKERIATLEKLNKQKDETIK